MTLNKDAFVALRAWLAGGGDTGLKFNMAFWHHEGPCRTVCCLGGYVEWALMGVPGTATEAEIAAFLGLTPKDFDRLAYPNTGPLNEIIPSEAIAVIDYLVATGQVDWAAALEVEA